MSPQDPEGLLSGDPGREVVPHILGVGFLFRTCTAAHPRATPHPPVRSESGTPKGHPEATKHRTHRVLYAQDTPGTAHSVVLIPRRIRESTPQGSRPTPRLQPPAQIGEAKSTVRRESGAPKGQPGATMRRTHTKFLTPKTHRAPHTAWFDTPKNPGVYPPPGSRPSPPACSPQPQLEVPKVPCAASLERPRATQGEGGGGGRGG